MSEPQHYRWIFILVNSIIWSSFMLRIYVQVGLLIITTVNGAFMELEKPEIGAVQINRSIDARTTIITQNNIAFHRLTKNNKLIIDGSESMAMNKQCTTMDLTNASAIDLMRCKKHWKALLNNVDLLLNSMSKKRRKRFTAIAPSLSDTESAFVLDRLNSIQVTDEDELIKASDASLGADVTAATAINTARRHRRPFNPKRNNSAEDCKRLSQQELVTELKQKGTYNPDLMAWDASGVIRFLDRSIVDQYERQIKRRTNTEETAERNVEALERILAELHLQCDVRKPAVLSRLRNLTALLPIKTAERSSSAQTHQQEMRSKRQAAKTFVDSFEKSRSNDGVTPSETSFEQKRQKIIGDVHVVPFGCDKRASSEDGYLRLCGACQAIRRLPDTFFPPFINEVMCDDDKACLYFYNFPHGKCKQKHMNFVVLRNMGTDDCQVWQKFNLNVRVSCECFVGKQYRCVGWLLYLRTMLNANGLRPYR